MKNVHPAISIVGYYQYNTNDKFPKSDPAQPVTETTPIFRNIHISNVTATCTQDAGLMFATEYAQVKGLERANEKQ
jgi:hypothetical protein